ncbi:MAG: VanW family protein [Actinobacteria bacterium]|nr:VanW family protein [Actinomycetota bacterium]
MLIIALAVFWRIDMEPSGVVARNVTLAGEPISGATESEVESEVRELERHYAHATIQVVAPDGGFTAGAAELDLNLQVAPTVQAALQTGKTGPAIKRFGSWLSSFFSPRAVDVHISFDETEVFALVSERDPGPRSEPREPSIEYSEGELQAVAGRPGKGIDAHEVIERLPEAADAGEPVRVEVARGVVYPRFTEEQAQKLAQEGERLTAGGLRVTDGAHSADISAKRLRSWLGSQTTGSGLELVVDTEATIEGLKALMPQVDRQPVDATFTVVDGQVNIVPGQAGLACCDDEAAQIIEQALLNETAGRIELPLAQVQPEVTEEDLEEMGVTHLVSSFTTNHQPDQPRVENIHRIADLVRGQVIHPGESFSVNEFIGPRTKEKGFVVDGVIEDGEFTESVGGGISQFATTLFNAAFFAGLDFPQYQSHSIYISRYPYGREATLSFPQPDLEIANPNPASVLIWTTYTDSSITVSLYSAPWAEVYQTDQRRSSRGPCTLVRTERTRIYPAEDRSVTDQVIALYRPAEGVDCR